MQASPDGHWPPHCGAVLAEHGTTIGTQSHKVPVEFVRQVVFAGQDPPHCGAGLLAQVGGGGLQLQPVGPGTQVVPVGQTPPHCGAGL